MKKSIAIVCVILYFFCAFSCTHKNEQQYTGDYVLIYSVGGIAGGSHPPFYLITPGRLQADTISQFYSSFTVYVGSLNFNAQFPAAKYNQVSGLLTKIPVEMLNNNGKDFGVASGADMVGIVVKASLSGHIYTWGFETDQSNCSPTIIQYSSLFSLL